MQRASGQVHEIQYTCRRRTWAHPFAVCVYTLLYIHAFLYMYIFLRTLHDAAHSRELRTWSDNFCPAATVTFRTIIRSTRRLRNLFVMLDEAICCFRVRDRSFGQSDPRGFRSCHSERLFVSILCDRRLDHCWIHWLHLPRLSCIVLCLFYATLRSLTFSFCNIYISHF